jgi:hypothetical protein
VRVQFRRAVYLRRWLFSEDISKAVGGRVVLGDAGDTEIERRGFSMWEVSVNRLANILAEMLWRRPSMQAIRL